MRACVCVCVCVRACSSQAKAKQKGGGGGAAMPDPDAPLATWLEFKVGKVLRAWNHETADRLYCEEIDVGEDAPRQIASGLREQMSLDELEGATVLVVTNLKPKKLVGFKVRDDARRRVTRP